MTPCRDGTRRNTKVSDGRHSATPTDKKHKSCRDSSPMGYARFSRSAVRRSRLNPAWQRPLRGSCSSTRSVAPRLLPTLGYPHAVTLRFARCDQLTGGLAPPGVRPCQAHHEKKPLSGFPDRGFHRIRDPVSDDSALTAGVRAPSAAAGLPGPTWQLRPAERFASAPARWLPPHSQRQGYGYATRTGWSWWS